jgi:hypothetical protein
VLSIVRGFFSGDKPNTTGERRRWIFLKANYDQTLDVMKRQEVQIKIL